VTFRWKNGLRSPVIEGNLLYVYSYCYICSKLKGCHGSHESSRRSDHGKGYKLKSGMIFLLEWNIYREEVAQKSMYKYMVNDSVHTHQLFIYLFLLIFYSKRSTEFLWTWILSFSILSFTLLTTPFKLS